MTSPSQPTSPSVDAEALEKLKERLREITKECVDRLRKKLGIDKPWRKVG